MKRLRRVAIIFAAPLLVLLSIVLISGPADAWSYNATARTACDNNGQAIIKGTFTNQDTGLDQVMLVTMETKGYAPDGPLTVQPQQTIPFEIDTAASSTPATLSVYFAMTWANGTQGNDSAQVNIAGISCSTTPTTTTTVPPVTTTTVPPPTTTTTTTSPPTTTTTTPSTPPTTVVPAAPVAPAPPTPTPTPQPKPDLVPGITK
jgi:hypothetical protein